MNALVGAFNKYIQLEWFVSSSILGPGPGGGQGGAQDEAGPAAGPGRQGGLRRAPRQDGPRYTALTGFNIRLKIKMYYRSWGTILMHELFVFGPTDLCRAKDADDSLPPIICVQLHCVKSKLMMNHLFQLYEMLRLSS